MASQRKKNPGRRSSHVFRYERRLGFKKKFQTTRTMSYKTPDGKTFETKKEWKKHYLSLLKFENMENKHDLCRKAPVGARFTDRSRRVYS